MTPTNDQIVAEAVRRREAVPIEQRLNLEDYVIEVVREGWTPPVVDQDVLAFREWFAQRAGSAPKSGILAGHWDSTSDADAYLAGARMAREQERKRAKVLLDYAWEDVGAAGSDGAKARSNRAFDIIMKYEKGGQ